MSYIDDLFTKWMKKTFKVQSENINAISLKRAKEFAKYYHKKKNPNKITTVPYQSCPACSATGYVFNSVENYTVSYQTTCPVCNGARIIPQCVLENKES
jgi:DnaJ-class molecular chaperone